MLFQNLTGYSVKVRYGTPGKYYWKTIKDKDQVDLDRGLGNRLNFTKVEQDVHKLGTTETKKETVSKETPKPEPNKEYRQALLDINGVGPKSAKDIMNVYKTAKDLIRAIDAGKELPFRDDIAIKLKKKLKLKYGGRHG